MPDAHCYRRAASAAYQTEPAVVFITVGLPNGTEEVGSGFIVGKRGEIVTCEHVASNKNTKITVTLYDGRSFPAQLIGADKETEVSVIKINAGKHLPTLSFGNSDALRQGDPVTVLGNPFGIKFSASFGRVVRRSSVEG